MELATAVHARRRALPGGACAVPCACSTSAGPVSTPTSLSLAQASVHAAASAPISSRRGATYGIAYSEEANQRSGERDSNPT
eukprot:14346841-Alexandrium_andersonii.AAC.1